MDKSGSLYGTTTEGGKENCVPSGMAISCGTVFRLDTTGKETVLYSFTGAPDGANPFAGLTMDKEGNLYGTTTEGGAENCAFFGEIISCGTLFKVDTTGKETVLYTFTGFADGANPYAGLIMGKQGNLYGTTAYGGTSNCPGIVGFNGCGTVFKLDTSENETVLHSFTGAPDGANPFAGLIMDKDGNLYGTTSGGGRLGYGTVFKLALAQ
ncbi:MAG: hypothetical protein DMG97_42650 [Acidobacteria bacterium]|nr:MAG: hypothetical protein DMG97_42650 [Acidobacteriota bacterium]